LPYNLESTIGGFSFNSISSHNMGLVCRTTNRFILSARKTRYVDFVNMNGSFALNSPNYELGKITVSATIDGGIGGVEAGQPTDSNFADLRTRMTNIGNWLSTPTWCDLYFFDNQSLIYKAKVDDEITGSLKQMLAVIEISIPFVIAMDEDS